MLPSAFNTLFNKTVIIFCFCVFFTSHVNADKLCNAEVIDEVKYRLNAGDLVSIEIWREDDLKKEVVIRPDGGISFPLIGDLHLAGLDLLAAKALLEEKLKKYIPEAIANISLMRSQGSQIFVVGKVNKPGDIPLFKQLSVLQALSIAGGTTVFADLNDIKVIRTCEEGQKVIPFDYTKIASGKDLEQNINLQSGDVIVVP